MAKLKTHKATAKRVRVTPTGKLLIRTAGQDHFNSRESGKVTRNKRRDHQISKTKKKVIMRALPYV